MQLVKNKILDLQYISETFEYSEEAQGLIWKRNQRPLGRKGDRAGGIDARTGQRVISLGDFSTPEPRVVWALFHNNQPPAVIKHKNGIRTDNRVENLEPRTIVEKRKVTHTELLTLLNYCPLTGELRWRVNMNSRARAGDIVSCSSLGYKVVKIYKIMYRVHVLAWLYMTGEWPLQDLDHIDRDRGNNKWANLRLASSSQNHWNASDKSRGNATGFRGVKEEGKRFSARVNKHGKTYHLGPFDTAEEAHIAYKKKCLELHGEFSIYKEAA